MLNHTLVPSHNSIIAQPVGNDHWLSFNITQYAQRGVGEVRVHDLTLQTTDQHVDINNATHVEVVGHEVLVQVKAHAGSVYCVFVPPAALRSMLRIDFPGINGCPMWTFSVSGGTPPHLLATYPAHNGEVPAHGLLEILMDMSEVVVPLPSPTNFIRITDLVRDTHWTHTYIFTHNNARFLL